MKWMSSSTRWQCNRTLGSGRATDAPGARKASGPSRITALARPHTSRPAVAASASARPPRSSRNRAKHAAAQRRPCVYTYNNSSTRTIIHILLGKCHNFARRSRISEHRIGCRTILRNVELSTKKSETRDEIPAHDRCEEHYMLLVDEFYFRLSHQNSRHRMRPPPHSYIIKIYCLVIGTIKPHSKR